jgi:hypothetical protein
VIGGSAAGHVALWSTHSGEQLSSLGVPSPAPSTSSSSVLPSHLRQLQTGDFSRCAYDRYTGMTSSLSTAGVVLWG